MSHLPSPGKEFTTRGSALASAPGKLIFFGEHAVVYGKLAVAFALGDLRVRVRATITPLTDEEPATIQIALAPLKGGVDIVAGTFQWDLHAVTKAIEHDVTQRDELWNAPAASEGTLGALEELCSGVVEGVVGKAVIPLLYVGACAAGGRACHVSVQVVDASLPVAAGLGSSAALSVAAAGAVLEAQAQALGKGGRWKKKATGWVKLVNEWALAAEKLYHGTPSGLDNTVSAYGGAVAFRRKLITSPPIATPPTPEVPSVDKEREEDLLPPTSTSPPPTPSHLMRTIREVPAVRVMVVNTRVPKDTKRLVAGVRERKAMLPDVIGPILDAIEGIAARCLYLLDIPPPDSDDEEEEDEDEDEDEGDGEGKSGKGEEEGEEEGEGEGEEEGGESGGGGEGKMLRRLNSANPGLGAAEGSVFVTRSPTTPYVPPTTPSHLFQAELPTLITTNHALLNAIGVGHPALDTVTTVAQAQGCAAKLTGAGGGGCAIVLLPHPKHHHYHHHHYHGKKEREGGEKAEIEKVVETIQEELSSHGFDCFTTTLGGPGITIETEEGE